MKTKCNKNIYNSRRGIERVVVKATEQEYETSRYNSLILKDKYMLFTKSKDESAKVDCLIECKFERIKLNKVNVSYSLPLN